jgi:transglutaminase-like putative cysteine protease
MNAWLVLVLVDVVAVAGFARCFTGPGELTAALVTLAVVHLVGHASWRARPGPRRRWWAVASAAAVLLPIGVVLGPTVLAHGPGGAAWGVLASDLRAAWRAFYFKVAPVPELPGLVLVTAWAAGALGLSAELIFSKRQVPAVVALVPGVAVYLFACSLGTGAWRVAGLACIAGAACWYLVAAAREREQASDVLVAVADTGLSPGRRTASYRAAAAILRIAVLAAAAAAVIGPNLPGARSAALVTWRGLGAAGTSTTLVPGTGTRAQAIEISTLVQVGEEEVDDPTVALFSVHSSIPTRELVAALDKFNGESWGASSAAPETPLGRFATSLRADEQRPVAPVSDGSGRSKLVQVFDVAQLGGTNLPAWGVPVAVDGAGHVTRDGPSGPLVSGTAIKGGSAYAVSSVIADPSTAQLEAAGTGTSERGYLQLPAPPQRLVSLARSIVAGASTPYEEALDLELYLTSSRFHYQLPSQLGPGTSAGGSGYADLVGFLFGSRTGYCQQFATAFAVLARIDGLPTRIAVGFLPGVEIGHDTWQVDGNDTHAWPQVLFARYGWIDFEPTPGATLVGSSGPSVSTTTRPPGAGATSTTVRPAHNLSNPPTRGSTGSKAPTSHGAGGSGATGLLWLLVPFAVGAWVLGVAFWRRSGLRRAASEPRAGVLAAWGEASRMLDLAGIRRRRAETFVELAGRAASAGVLSREAELALLDLARLATSACYSAAPPGEGGAFQALADARTVARSARDRVAHWQLVAAALDPRGLVW